MDASDADKLILLVQTNQVLYDKSAAEYKVKDALEKGDIWQIGVDIAVNSERRGMSLKRTPLRINSNIFKNVVGKKRFFALLVTLS